MQIEFIAVTKETAPDILALEVKSTQTGFIETTAECLIEAEELAIWRPVGIYVDAILVGFAMYALWENEGTNGRVWLDRFLIDHHHQGKGYAPLLLQKLIEKITKEYACTAIYLSIYENNLPAIQIYKKLGFCFTGEVDTKGELVMVLR